MFAEAGRASSTPEPWSNHLHFIIQSCSPGTWGEIAQQKQLFHFKQFYIKACSIQALCVTRVMKKEVSQQLKGKKMIIMKIEGINTHPEEACFSIFMIPVSLCVKDGK